MYLSLITNIVVLNVTKLKVKKLLEGKARGGRRNGGPRLRWMVDVELDLRARGVRRWRARALDSK
jgi:hypothetical protein